MFASSPGASDVKILDFRGADSIGVFDARGGILDVRGRLSCDRFISWMNTIVRLKVFEFGTLDDITIVRIHYTIVIHVYIETAIQIPRYEGFEGGRQAQTVCLRRNATVL